VIKKNRERVFVAASTSNSALGKQQDLLNKNDDAIVLSKVPVGESHALYYAIQNHPLNKSFDLMMNLLIEQIDLLLAQTQLTKTQLQKTMLFIGSTSLDVGCIKSDSTKDIWLSQTDKIGQQLAEHFSLNSLHFTFNTACTAGANALLYATNFIKLGKIDNAIVISFEFFNQLSLNGFDSLDLISKNSVKPFSSARDGLILGEGIGAVLLSKYQAKLKHKDEQAHIEILGGYSSCDDYSLTITEESGTHIIDVIEKSLHNAGIEQCDIDLIKVHGTASVKSDLAEYNALHQFFSDIPNVCAFKSYIGHTLGACGVIELALFDHFTHQAYLPELAYQKDNSDTLLLPFITSATQLAQSKIMLFNHFGFGGNNAALIIKKWELT
jgi:3-oxoacyl-[acyl-carrier-protein] synthase-1